ncbi:Serine/threonine-protein kinase RUNKEL [Beauveria bassiana]|nr:Serine/threonine-protein kinase RUNKEL [Beauveria bassiana]
MSSTRPELEVVEYHHYLPHGIHYVLATGTSAFIGQVDDSTVVGRHDRSIAQQGLNDGSLYLEYATNGPILDLLLESKHATVAPAAENLVQRVVHVHSKRVIHCNIDSTNILLDENPHAKLADFQG